MMMTLEQSRHSSQNNAASMLPFVACRRRNTLFSVTGRPLMRNPYPFTPKERTNGYQL